MTGCYPGAACPTTHRLPIAGAPPTTTVRGRYWWVRWAVSAVVAIVLTVEAILVWGSAGQGPAQCPAANWQGPGGHRRGDAVDAQLRPDPACKAAVGGRRGTPVAIRGGLLRGQPAEHHAARRTGAVGPRSCTGSSGCGGCPAAGRPMAAGDVRRTVGGGAGAAGSAARSCSAPRTIRSRCSPSAGSSCCCCSRRRWPPGPSCSTVSAVGCWPWSTRGAR